MFKIKDILYGIKSRKGVTILLILQLSISLSIILSILKINLTGTMMTNNNKWIIDISDCSLVSINDIELSYNEKLYKESFEDALKKVKEMKYGSIASYSSISLDLKSIFKENVYTEGLAIDKSYYDMINKNIIKGEGFTVEDLKENSGELTPIILGSSYKSKCDLDEIVEDSNGDKYIIKGFFKGNKYAFFDRFDSFLNTKTTYLIPFKDTQSITEIIVKNKNSENNNDVYINEDFTLKNIKFSIKREVDEWLEFNKRWSPYVITATGVGIIGIIASTVLSIHFRKREFGIKLVLGESLNSIAFNFLIENCLLSAISIIGSYMYIIISNREVIKLQSMAIIESIISINFNFEFLFLSIVIVIFIMMITTFITFIVINKMKPKELIGGVD